MNKTMIDKTYDELLQEKALLKENTKRIGRELRLVKKNLHEQVVHDNKTAILLLDIFFVLTIMCNCGALIITNAMVTHDDVKDLPVGNTIMETIEISKQKVTFVEANPKVAKDFGFATSEEANNSFSAIFTHLVMIGFLCATYVFVRRTFTDDEMITTLIINVVVLFIMCFFDFGNDVGYLIGVLWR